MCLKFIEIKTIGHTGFKGSWLISWLKFIGADVVGISLPHENDESLFASTGIKNAIHDYRLDIRDADQLSKIIQDEKTGLYISPCRPSSS